MPATIESPMRIKPTFFADALTVLGSNLIVIVSSFLSGIVISRWLGPVGQGVLQGLLIYPIIIASTIEMGVRQSTIYYTGAKLFCDKAIVESLLFLFTCSTFVGVCLCFCLTAFSVNSETTLVMILLASLYIPMQLTTSFANGFFLGKELIGRFAIINAFGDFPRLIFILLLLVVCNYGVMGGLIATLLGSSFVAGYALWLLSREQKLSIRLHRDIVVRLVSTGALYAISLLILQLNYNIGIIIMNQMGQNADVGFYSVGASWAIVLWHLPNALGLVLFSRSANSIHNAPFAKRVGRLSRIAVLAVALTAIVIFLIADPLIPFVYGDQFAPSVSVLRAILPGIVSFTFFRILYMDIAGRGKPWLSMICTLPSLLFSVIANLIFIPRYGATGAAIASSIGFTIGSFIMLVVYCRVTRIPYLELIRYSRDDFFFNR